MTSISTLKDSERVQFCLDGGEVFDYLVTPDRTYIDHINAMVDLYVALSYTKIPTNICVRPDVYAALCKEYVSAFKLIGNTTVVGYHNLKLHTLNGVVTIESLPHMRWPIFVGTPEEYKSSDFDLLLDKVLST